MNTTNRRHAQRHGGEVMDEFDRRVNNIGRRKALAFFAKRIAALLVFLYFAIAAYGRYYGAQP